MDPSALSIEGIARAVAQRQRLAMEGAERYAAVAAILREGTHGPDVLLIRRSDAPGDPWSGHIAMPGGKQDPGDPTLEATAVREAHEEVGIDLLRVGRSLGPLDHTPAYARGRSTGMVVAPFVFELTSHADVTPSHEVQEALWVPLRPLVGADLRRSRPYVHDGVPMNLPCWDYQGRIIWGLTYFMLDGLLRVSRGA